MDERIPINYAVLLISEILYEKGLLNHATYKEIRKRLKPEDSHISQSVSA